MKPLARSIAIFSLAVLILFFRIARLQTTAADTPSLALTGAKIYTSPTAALLVNRVILIRGDKIVSVAPASSLAVPKDTKTLDCTGSVVVAGFQNSHVHFTEDKWNGAGTQPAEKLTKQLEDMLTRYGFTTAVDLGSFLANTVALRKRVESGEVVGPRILTAGGGLYPPNGPPFYIPDAIKPLLAEPATPEAAIQVVQSQISGGADVIKLFTGSLFSRTEIKLMPADVAAAAVSAAHQRHLLVFAHPSNIPGVEVALDAGVDVLAHTTPISGKWDDALIAKMLDHHMSLTPTLKLWLIEARKDNATPEQAEKFAVKGAAELGQYQRAGGQVLFGTDVGYVTDYDVAEEYRLMSQAGLTPMQILASLTTAPAARFGESQTRGQIAKGMDADLVVLGADPANDANNLAKVRYTIRHGQIIYTAPSGESLKSSQN
jgi:imidazolonepropionase-like amidohydrolase